MDELIYLETDEEITSVIDKLQQVETDSVGLVAPKGSSIIQSIVNLKILKKEAESLGKKIAIVTSDEIGRNLAAQVGLIVYESVKSTKPVVEPPRPDLPTAEVIEIDLSQKKRDISPTGIQVRRYDEPTGPRPKEVAAAPETKEPITHIAASPISTDQYTPPRFQTVKKPVNYKVFLALSPLFLVLLVGFVLFYFKTNVSLGLRSEEFTKNVGITVDNNARKTNLENSIIPGDIQEKENEQEKTFTATGKKNIGGKATGTITVYNRYDSNSHSYPSLAKFTGGGKTFLANSGFTVPGASVMGGSVSSGKIDVAITAEEAGDSYNLGSTDFALEGAPSQISGHNSQSFAGGFTKDITVVSNDDINKAKDDLVRDLSDKNHQELIKKADGQVIIESTIKDETAAFSTDKKADEETNEFKASAKVKSSAFSFYENNYRELIAYLLQKEVPSGKELVPTSSDEMSITKKESDFNQGTMKIAGLVKTHLAPKIDQSALKKAIKGKNAQEAELILKQNNDIETVEFQPRPSWWNRLPFWPSRIFFSFNYL